MARPWPNRSSIHTSCRRAVGLFGLQMLGARACCVATRRRPGACLGLVQHRLPSFAGLRTRRRGMPCGLAESASGTQAFTNPPGTATRLTVTCPLGLCPSLPDNEQGPKTRAPWPLASDRRGQAVPDNYLPGRYRLACATSWPSRFLTIRQGDGATCLGRAPRHQGLGQAVQVAHQATAATILAGKGLGQAVAQ